MNFIRTALVIGLLSRVAPAAHASPLQLVRLDGTRQSVDVDSISPDGLAAGDMRIPFSDLRRIIPSPPAATVAPGRRQVQLIEGGIAHGGQVTIAEDRVTLLRGSGPAWSFPIDAVRAVRLDSLVELDSYSDALVAPATVKDRLFIRLEDAPVMIEGYLESLSDTQAVFDWMDETRTLDRDRLYGVIFASVAPPVAGPAPLTVLLADGSRLPAAAMASAAGPSGEEEAGQLRVTLSGETEVVIPWTEIAAVSLHSDRLLFLSDLAPVDVVERPIVALPRSWQADRSVSGAPLVAEGMAFDRGLGMQSGTSLTFDLEDQWSGFVAHVALDPAARGGDCEFVVSGEGRELARVRVRAGQTPRPLRVPLSGITRLKLSVEYGENLDLGDQALWCDAYVFSR